MKLSINFLKDYIDLETGLKEFAEDMTRIGNEYDSAEKLINATKLIIGEVKECENHPDSDHLHICKVNVGTEILDIVCGAPNVRKGLKVIVALDGAVLPGDFRIKKSKIRGQESNGMLCALNEIGIESKFLSEKEKGGIHELDRNAPIGEDPIKYLKLDDEIVNFELTANRGDLLSILGMAYEAGALYNKKVKNIDLSYNEQGEDFNNNFSIDIDTEDCSIFLAKRVEQITIKESPEFIRTRLIASGIRPINNVVDISNYVMLETGQPLHFYDANRLGNKIVVRQAKHGEKLVTLDNIERVLEETDIVIADKEKAIGLAGVMGGLSTEIENDTKNIVIESAIFDSIKIRNTSKKILRSEASIRFEKGLDSNRTYMAVERACNLLEKYADAKIMKGLVKYDKTDLSDKKIEITVQEINRVLGTTINKKDILDVFSRLGFSVTENGDNLIVLVPKRRTDISIKEDLIEEVGRIYGVDKIAGKLPVIPVKPGNYDKTTREIRNKMISLGLNETLSYILINEKEVKEYTLDEFESVKLLDPMTEERNTLRYSVLTSLYKIYEYNKARNIKDVSVFEIGKGFYKRNGEYGETQKLAVLLTGEFFLGIGEEKTVDFYILKGIAEELLEYLGFGSRYSFMVTQKFPKEFHPYQSVVISINNDTVGTFGRLNPEKTKEDVYVMEIDLDKLLSKKVEKMKFKELSKFPAIKKDLAIIVDENINSKEIETIIRKFGGKLLINIKAFDIYRGEAIEKGKKSIAYSLTFEDSNKTLTDEEILEIIEKIVSELNKKLNATLRR